jgi:hypothetical protein
MLAVVGVLIFATIASAGAVSARPGPISPMLTGTPIGSIVEDSVGQLSGVTVPPPPCPWKRATKAVKTWAAPVVNFGQGIQHGFTNASAGLWTPAKSAATSAQIEQRMTHVGGMPFPNLNMMAFTVGTAFGVFAGAVWRNVR